MGERCEGPGNLPSELHKPCPYNRKGDRDDVSFSQVDLWLCAECKNALFGGSRQPAPSDPNSTLEDNKVDEPGDVILEPLLPYAVYGMMGRTLGNVKTAIVSHFSDE